MGDIADYANEAADFRLEIAKKNLTLEPVAKATGFCLNCEEPLPDNRRWCSKECAEEWCNQQKRLNGR